ncbi:hypothetical protein [Paenibacillus sp. 481]|uniref:hypothetical protein n=1 Tax=Paenibacillus sp. 481 TaxID=2835869 RepID=UPI001E6528EA|nr:hypothetical protein [Paenibacillus sp. 481]UHA75156.1 hypothetical protein KIK04_09095 [Paenibacillus sp. 481]
MAVGACIYGVTAFADSTIGSGYDRFKGSLLHTTAQLEKDLDNYTIKAVMTLKENDKTLYQSTTTSKNDIVKQAVEEFETVQDSNGEVVYYHMYRDKEHMMSKSSLKKEYSVAETDKNVTHGEKFNFTSTVESRDAAKIVSVVDSVVGHMKDDIQVGEQSDNGKVYAVNWSEGQTPVMVNPLFPAYNIKQTIDFMGGASPGVPEIESDLYIKKFTGKAVENKSGLLEDVTGDVVVSGKDKNGKQHDLTLSVVVKLSDIGDTKLVKPDVVDENVKWHNSYVYMNKDNYVGKYKNDIIVDNKGKIGERTIEITSMSPDKVAGRYYETVNSGFEADLPSEYNFSFDFNPKETGYFFAYINSKGRQEYGQIVPHEGEMLLNLNIEIADKSSFFQNPPPHFNGQFTRVIEK